MESESNKNNYIGIYHHAVNSGLFNSSIISKEYIHVDNMVPLVRVNNFFFGTSNFADKFNYLNLAKENIVRKEYGIYYLETKKLENYNHNIKFLQKTLIITCNNKFWFIYLSAKTH